MRSRTSHDERVAGVTRRRLAALSAELGRADPAPAIPEPETGRELGPREETEALASASAPASAPAPESAPAGRHARRPVPPRRRLADCVSDHTPTALQGRALFGRAHLGSAQVGLVCLVVAAGLVLAAWSLVRAAGTTGDQGEVVAPRPVQPATAAADGTPEGAAEPSGPVADTGTATGETGPAGETGATGATGTTGVTAVPEENQIVVDVVGKVRRPGIAVLPAGSRVVDAVRAAGGVRAGVPPASVNMARLLTDGEQVVVGRQPALASAAGAALSTPGVPATGALVNLNTADQVTLETLPGVGPVTAAAILQWRTDHGGFTSVDELLEVSGIGDAILTPQPIDCQV